MQGGLGMLLDTGGGGFTSSPSSSSSASNRSSFDSSGWTVNHGGALSSWVAWAGVALAGVVVLLLIKGR